LTRNPLVRALDRAVLAVLANRRLLALIGGALALFLVGTIIRGWGLGLFLVAALVAGAQWAEARRRANRRAELERQLVPALRTLATGVESGLSFAQALDRVVHDAP